MPQFEGHRDRIDVDLGPPSSLVAMAVQLTMMHPADRDREFIADRGSDRPRLRESQVMRVGWEPATHPGKPVGR